MAQRKGLSAGLPARGLGAGINVAPIERSRTGQLGRSLKAIDPAAFTARGGGALTALTSGLQAFGGIKGEQEAQAEKARQEEISELQRQQEGQFKQSEADRSFGLQRETLDLKKAEGAGLSEFEKAKQKALGKTAAEDIGSFQTAKATLPALEQTVGKLGKLGEDATHSLFGRGIDEFARQFGFSTEGGEARKEFESVVNNQVLPLLKQTFGAAFTVKEGESLKETLGDVNATPAEKQKVLQAFIKQKRADLATKGRKIGVQVDPTRGSQSTAGNIDSDLALMNSFK
jgi:hypothetical protein